MVEPIEMREVPGTMRLAVASAVLLKLTMEVLMFGGVVYVYVPIS